jgi:transposase
MEMSTMGLDLAKRVSQVHGADASGRSVLRRKLQRAEVLAFFGALPSPCGVGIEACGTAQLWTSPDPARDQPMSTQETLPLARGRASAPHDEPVGRLVLSAGRRGKKKGGRSRPRGSAITEFAPQ